MPAWKATERHIDSVKRIVASLVMMPSIIMPVVLSEGEGDRYWLIDGWGRIDAARFQLKHDAIKAMVLPPTDLDSRMALRLSLNTGKPGWQKTKMPPAMWEEYKRLGRSK